jgi:hypothetical protein
LALPHLRARKALLGAVAVNAMTKTYEQRIADLIRHLGAEHDGEVLNTMSALRKTLASRNLTFTDLGDGIEKLATGGLTQSAMEQIRDAAYAKGVLDAKRKLAAAQTVFRVCHDDHGGREGSVAHFPAQWLAGNAADLYRQNSRAEIVVHRERTRRVGCIKAI